MSEDLYKILGVDKQSTLAQIRTAYRKLASKYHPDKSTGDEEKFKSISLAYQILSDPDRRALYDKSGKYEGKKRTLSTSSPTTHRTYAVDNQNMAFSGLFEGIFGSGKTDIEVTLKDVYFGSKKTIYDQFGKAIEVTIPRGVADGYEIKLADQRPVKILYVNQTPYRVQGRDLHLDLQISLKEALTGVSRNLQFIDGSIIQVETDSKHVIQPESIVTYPGGGLPIGDSDRYGDLIVHYHVQLPQTLDAEARINICKFL